MNPILKRCTCRRGFTLIELLIVIALIGILAAIAAPNYQMGVIRAREAVLQANLRGMRDAIDQYFADQGKYPDSLQELAEKRYLRTLPPDPMTGKNDGWVTLGPPAAPDGGQPPKGSVYDVKSSSNKVGTNNVPYNEW